MSRRVKGGVGVLALLASGLVALVMVPANPASAACAVGVESGVEHGFFTGNNVNVRSGPRTSCEVVLVGQSSHTLRYDCWDYGTAVTRNGYTYTTWSHIMDETVWTSGWVSDAFLSNAGAKPQCYSAGVLKAE